jgi:hypothetical protein
MKQRTPQEKKTLSYTKDCRNTYGESDKGSRKSIKRNKTFPTRAYRKTVNNLLQATVGTVDLEAAELANYRTKNARERRG